jgi:hypothetical protein
MDRRIGGSEAVAFPQVPDVPVHAAAQVAGSFGLFRRHPRQDDRGEAGVIGEKAYGSTLRDQWPPATRVIRRSAASPITSTLRGQEILGGPLSGTPESPRALETCPYSGGWPVTAEGFQSSQ